MSFQKLLNHTLPLAAAVSFALAGCVSLQQQTASTQGTAAASSAGGGNQPTQSASRPVVVQPSGPRIANKIVPSGSTTTVEGIFMVNIDCSSRTPPTIKISQQPVHGTAAVVQRDDFPTYPPNNPRVVCNKIKSPGTFVDYTPAPGFTGSDFMAIQLFTDTGQEAEEKIAITVK